ncbi:MAG: DUF2125 domain-containing protein [Pseudomonadota bacterium]
MKRTIILFAIMVILAIGWSAAWFYIEDKAIEAADRTTERLAERGRIVDCSNRQTGGYPFRISFTCDGVSYQDQLSGLSVSAGKLRSAAQAYQPGKVVMELEGPAEVQTAGNGDISINWASMRASAGFGLEGRQRGSLVGTDIEINPLQDPSRITAAQVEYHDRRSGENDLDLAVVALDMKETGPTTLGLIDFDLRSEAMIRNVHGEFSRGRSLRDIIRRQGAEGELQRFHIVLENGAEVKLSGPFQADRNGFVDATMSFEVKNLDALLRIISFLNPGHEKNIERAGQSIKLLAPADENGFHTVTLNIRKNVIALGLLPIGRLPYWL